MKKTYLFFIIVLLISILVIGHFVIKELLIQSRQRETRLHTINTYWNDQDYEKLVGYVDAYQKDFFHDDYVMLLHAFSQFNILFLENINDLSSIDNETLWSTIRTIRRIIALKNSSLDWEAEAYYVLGKAYYFLSNNDINKSIIYLKKAQSLGFYIEDIDEYLIAAYRKLGDFEAAETVLMRTIRENPKFIYFEILLDMYLDTRQDESVSDIMKKAQQFVKTKEDIESLKIIEARELTNKNKLNEAEVLLLEVLGSNEQSASAYFFLGNVYERMNKMVKARFHWRQAYKLRPTWEEVIVKLKSDNS